MGVDEYQAHEHHVVVGEAPQEGARARSPDFPDETLHGKAQHGSVQLLPDRAAEAVSLGLGDALHDFATSRGVGDEQVLERGGRLRDRGGRGRRRGGRDGCRRRSRSGSRSGRRRRHRRLCRDRRRFGFIVGLARSGNHGDRERHHGAGEPTQARCLGHCLHLPATREADSAVRSASTGDSSIDPISTSAHSADSVSGHERRTRPTEPGRPGAGMIRPPLSRTPRPCAPRRASSREPSPGNGVVGLTSRATRKPACRLVATGPAPPSGSGSLAARRPSCLLRSAAAQGRIAQGDGRTGRLRARHVLPAVIEFREFVAESLPLRPTLRIAGPGVGTGTLESIARDSGSSVTPLKPTRSMCPTSSRRAAAAAYGSLLTMSGVRVGTPSANSSRKGRFTNAGASTT